MGITRTARVQVTIAQRRSKPGTQRRWSRPCTRAISTERSSGPSPADQINRHPNHPPTQPHGQVSERTPDGKQPHEMVKCQDRWVRASAVARNVTNCGSANRHGAKTTRTARVQATIAQRRPKPDTGVGCGRVQATSQGVFGRILSHQPSGQLRLSNALTSTNVLPRPFRHHMASRTYQAQTDPTIDHVVRLGDGIRRDNATNPTVARRPQ